MKMNARTLVAIAAASAAGLATTAHADHLLTVDLGVVNQITITSAGGLAAVSASGPTGTGFYLANFYNGAGTGLSSVLVTGNLSSANDPSDNTPLLFRSSASVGLNVWSYSTNSTSTFTAGTVAFSGSGTWTVSAALYAEMLAGNTAGNVFFPADTDDDITPNTANLGRYVVIPTPSSLALMGLGLVGAARRRR